MFRFVSVVFFLNRKISAKVIVKNTASLDESKVEIT
jgi:hypothetical protein